ncbi:MAG: 4-hydroxythreonine-4-phosphate dehydrogenase PdxA [Vampirovibrionales bacterium]|nr:4-hydroxythreonine-4-phosphate dehydrogenase PdxA [Vampirovibrionales bacterium]
MFLPAPLLITMGDPTGIGPEIVAKFLAEVVQPPDGGLQPIWVFGAMDALRSAAETSDLTLPAESIRFRYIHTVNPRNPHPGETVVQALQKAVANIAQAYQAGKPLPALVTGPIQKTHLWQAGYAHQGHTELLADLALAAGLPVAVPPEMLFVVEQLRMLLLTRHVALSEVSQALTVEGVTQSLLTLVATLQSQGMPRPTIALLGVNPHAGEVGGVEEKTILKPAAEAVMKSTGATIVGPLAADGALRGLNAQTPLYDAFVAAYHDQGLIPIKLLGGWKTVNVTLGLPFWRTSVSHGTANDIVGRDLASADSLKAAVAVAQHWMQQPMPLWKEALPKALNGVVTHPQKGCLL